MSKKRNPAKEDLERRLREGLRRQPEIKLITQDEYTILKEIAAFKCPHGWNINHGCAGHRCPPKNKDKSPFSDYYWECKEAGRAIRALEAVTRGETAVVSTGNGWTMPL